MLLKKGGRTVYFGPIGLDAHLLRDYLKKHGAVPKKSDNVAEFMLEAIGAGSAPQIGSRDWADIWQESPELADVKETIKKLKDERLEATRTSSKSVEKEFASPFWHQFAVVLNRMNRAFWRSPNYEVTRLVNHLIVALITGLTYLNLDNSRSSLQNKVFVMFQVTVLPPLILSQVEVMYHIRRAIFFRESSAKMYSTTTFALSIIIAEVPYSILCAVIFFLPLYYIPGLQSESSRAGYQFFIILITELFSITLGQVLAALAPSAYMSTQFDPFVMITFALFVSIPRRTYREQRTAANTTTVRCYHPQAANARLLAGVALRAEPLHPPHRRNGHDGAPRAARELQARGVQPVHGAVRPDVRGVHERLLQGRRHGVPRQRQHDGLRVLRVPGRRRVLRHARPQLQPPVEGPGHLRGVYRQQRHYSPRGGEYLLLLFLSRGQRANDLQARYVNYNKR